MPPERWFFTRNRPSPGQSDLRDLCWRYLWAQAQGDRHSTFEPHDGIANFASYSPDGRLLLTAGVDRKLNVWNAKTLAPIKKFDSDTVPWVGGYTLFSPDSSQLAAVHNRKLTIWDAHQWDLLAEFKDVSYPVAYSLSGGILTARDGHAVRVWDVETHKSWLVAPELGEHAWAHAPVWAITPDGNHLAFGSHPDKRLHIWKTRPAEEIAHFESPGVIALAICPKGEFLAESTRERTLRACLKNP